MPLSRDLLRIPEPRQTTENRPDPTKRDRLAALGFFGAHLQGALVAVLLVVLLDAQAWWRWPLGAAVFLISLIPMWSAVGLWRYHHAVEKRARRRHNQRFGVG